MGRDGLFYGAQFLARLADQILLFLVPLIVFQMTGSIGWSGVAFFIETLPRYIAFPIVGILTDRLPAYPLIRWSQGLRALACLLGSLGAVAVGGIVWLLLLSAVCGVLTMQAWIAREAILPKLFPGKRLETILSSTQIADQLGIVLGPMVAAGMLMVIPWEAAVAATAALFLLADQAMLMWWRRVKPVLEDPKPAAEAWFRPLQTAFGHIWTVPGLKLTIFLAVGVNLVLGVTLATTAALVTGAFAQSETVFGLLQAAGAVATVAILAWIARSTLAVERMGALGYGLIALGGVLTALAPHPALYALGYLLVVGFDKMFAVYMRSLRQRLIPTQDFGKTTGVMVMLNNLSQPLAGALVGFTQGPAEARSLILAISIAAMISGALAFIAVRRAAAQKA